MTDNTNYLNALNRCFEQDCQMLELLEIPEYEVSDKFKNKMSKLIGRQRKPYFKLICTTGRRAACIVVAVIVLSASSLTVKAVREAVYDFFMKVFSDHTVVSTASNSENSSVDTIQEYYEITDMPDGFELVDSSITDVNCAYNYRCEDKRIIFSQTVNSMFSTNLDNENATIEKTIIDGTEYIIQERKEDSTFIWSNEAYTFEISGNIDKDTIINMCKSTKIK